MDSTNAPRDRGPLAIGLVALALLAACGGSGGGDNGGGGTSKNGEPTSSGATTPSGAGGSGGQGGAVSAGGATSTGTAGGGASDACAAVKTGVNADFGGYRMFPADHPFNQRVDSLPVHARSAAWLANCSSVPHLQLFPGMPYNNVPKNTPPVTATNFDYNPKPYPNPWPFPANAVIEGGDPNGPGDHHCLAFDVGDCKLYEVYNIHWAADHRTFTAASGTVWDTTKNDPGNGSGSDAAGMPITPILLRNDELFVHHLIEHAIRITCEFSEEGHVAPARASAASTGGSGKPADPHDLDYPPMGMRLRLKASFDPTAHGYPPWIVDTLVALQKYGMILADNGGGGTPIALCGDASDGLNTGTIDDAYMLKQITTDDLEAVDTGPVTQD